MFSKQICVILAVFLVLLGGSVAATVNATFSSVDSIPVTSPSYVATGKDVTITLSFAPPTGTNLTIINNTGLGFISGQFTNLSHGERVFFAFNGVTYPYLVNYFGGSGNDLVLHWASQGLASWGANSFGVLGNGDTWLSKLPVGVVNTGVLKDKTVIAVATSTSDYFSLALCSDGTLAAWGNNTYGQLGNGSSGSGVRSNIPLAVNRSGALAGKTVVAVATGYFHSLALCSDGTVAGWGKNDSGQLGNGGTSSAVTVPVPVNRSGVLSGKTVVAISAGIDCSLALCSDGTLASWGNNSYGILGNGGSDGSRVPVLVARNGILAGKTVTAISVGQYTALALCSDGTIAAWGLNNKGQLGNGNTTDSGVPVEVSRTGILNGKSVTGISTSGAICLAMCSDNTLASWGDNYYGQLGFTGESRLPSFSSLPLLVTQGGEFIGKKVVSISTGGAHSLALYSDGTLAAWGYNADGQLGNNRADNSPNYSIVSVNISQSGVLAGNTVVGVSAGTLNSLAIVARPISSDSTLSGLTFHSGTLNPSFASTTTSYVISVPDSITTLNVSPKAAFSAAKLEVNGAAVASDAAVTTISLLSENNVVTVLVTAQDGITKSTYTVTVKREVNANLVSPDGVLIEGPGYNAIGNIVNFSLKFAPATGSNFTIINNIGLEFILGQFANLPQGQELLLDYDGVSYRFVANYYGGTGNDLVLQWAYQDLIAWGDNDKGALGNNSTIGSTVPVPVTQNGVLNGKTIFAFTGSSHNLAVCSDGTLAAWGSNSSGQLGRGNTTDSTMPAAVIQTGVLKNKTVIAVAAGGAHSLALCSDGTLAAWGSNLSGQLGNNSKTTSYLPVAVSQTGILAGKKVMAISAGGNHSLARCSDGTLVSWGDNSTGQLGNGSNAQSLVPTAVTQSGFLASKTAVAVSAGYDFSIVLCSDGSLASWGNNNSGQLGNGNTTSSTVAVEILRSGPLSGKKPVEIATGYDHSMARCLDGTLMAWGGNTEGQLGNGSLLTSNVPVQVFRNSILEGKTVVEIDTGSRHSLARCSDGTLVAWGFNSRGQLGNNSVTNSSIPVAVISSGILKSKAVVSSVAASGHSLVLAARPISSISTLSKLVLSSGVLSPTFSSITTSYTASVPSSITSIMITPETTYPRAVITVNGRTVSSGVASIPFPLMIGENPINVIVTAEDGVTQSSYTIVVSRGILNAIFAAANSTPVTATAYNPTGYDIAFTLGFAPRAGSVLTVVDNTGLGFILGKFSNLIQGQAVNLNHNGVTYPFVANYYGGTGNDLVLQWAQQDLIAWGYNGTGELGNGGTADSSVPVMVSKAGVLGGKTVIALAAGANHNLALCSDGTLVSWGSNRFGQLGNGNNLDSSIPIAVRQDGVLSGKTIVSVSAGYRHSVALCSDGTLATWGENDYGQLGNNTTSPSSIPVAVSRTGVLAGKTVVSVTAGSSHAMVLCSDGTLAGWGRNDTAQIGGAVGYSGTVPVLLSPTGVLTGKSVVSIKTGASHNLALCSDGTLGLWGYNDLGQIGNGSGTINSGVYVPTTPILTGVLAGKTIVGLGAGDFHSFALCSDGTLASWGYNIGSVPVAVGRSSALATKTITSIASRFNTLVLCSDGTLATWSGPSSLLTAMQKNGALAGRTVTSIAAGYSHSLVTAAIAPDEIPEMFGPAVSTSVTDTSATLGGIVSSEGSSPITERGIVYSITSVNADPKIGGLGVSRRIASGTTGEFKLSVTGLASSRSYSFKAYAINSAGVAYTSPASSFLTLFVDPAISMSASQTQVVISGDLEYTIQVSNGGSFEATSVSVIDSLPETLSFVSASVPKGWTSRLPNVGSGGLISFIKNSSMPAGTIDTLRIVARVRGTIPNGTVIVNKATVSSKGNDFNLGNNTAVTSTPVGTSNPSNFQVSTTAALSNQNGLFELTVNVTNTTPRAINGFRLHVDYSSYLAAQPSLRLSNASSPAGSSDVYVDHPYPVAVDSSVPVKLLFYTSNRRFPNPFTPVLSVEILASSAVSDTNGNGVQPRVVSMTGGNLLLEFPSIPGSWYRVRYSPDMTNWFDCPAPIKAIANRTQWIDSGAPFTPVPPWQAPSRFYRVNEISVR